MDEIKKRIADGLEAQRALGHKGDSWDNHAVAYATVESELGIHKTLHDLDEATRNTLIINGRQDSAHALLNTTSLLKRVHQLSRLVYLLLAAVVILGALVLPVLLQARF